MINSCAAIIIAAKHGELIKVKDASGIAYTVGTLRCKFDFRTTDWNYTTRTAVFCKGNVSTNPKIVDTAIGVVLDGVDECAVPPEVLLPDEKYFSVGVWGVTNDGLRIVSEWIVFRIKDGCYVNTTESFMPTPSVYEQIMMSISSKAPIEHKHEEYITEEMLANKEYATETFIEDILKDYIKEAEFPSALSDLKDDEMHRTVTDAEKQTWNSKVDKINGKGLSTNDYTDEDKEKVNKLSDKIISKDDVGLGNVDNTADIDKPVSTAQQKALDDKVDKVNGKGLSANDYTDSEKEKLASIAEGAEANVQSDWHQMDSTKADYIKNKPTILTEDEVIQLIDEKLEGSPTGGSSVEFGETEGTAYEGNKGKKNADDIAQLKNDVGDIGFVLDEIIALQELYINNPFDEVHEYAQNIIDGEVE